MSKDIEVEGGEIAIQNSHGDVAIIPIKDVSRVKKMLKNPAEVDEYVAGLPKMSDYAEDGTILEGGSGVLKNTPAEGDGYNYVKLGENITEPVKVNEPKLSQNITPDIDLDLSKYKFDDSNLKVVDNLDSYKCKTKNCSEFTTTEHANIMGYDRADIERDVSADAWYKRDKVVNKGGSIIYDSEEYSDKLDTPEYWSNLDIKEGDFVSLSDGTYSKTKDQPETNKEGYKKEGLSRHSGIIVGKNKDGIPLVRHNFTGTVLTEPITKIDKVKKYRPSSIFRSPVIKSSDKIKDNAKKAYINEIYSNKDDISLKDPNVGGELLDSYRNVREKAVKSYNVPPKFLDEAFKNLMGISSQESNLDNELPIDSVDDLKSAVLQSTKKYVPNTINNLGKAVINSWNGISSLGDEKDGREEISGYKYQLYLDKGATREELDKKYKQTAGDKVYGKSYGPFKQKEPSKEWLDKMGDEYSFKESLRKDSYGKEWNDNDERYIENALGLYIQNYKKAKKKYPKESADNHHKIAILAHNSPPRAFDKEYFDYYIKGKGNDNPKKKNSGYVSKSMNYRKQLIK